MSRCLVVPMLAGVWTSSRTAEVDKEAMGAERVPDAAEAAAIEPTWRRVASGAMRLNSDMAEDGRACGGNKCEDGVWCPVMPIGTHLAMAMQSNAINGLPLRPLALGPTLHSTTAGGWLAGWLAGSKPVLGEPTQARAPCGYPPISPV